MEPSREQSFGIGFHTLCDHLPLLLCVLGADREVQFVNAAMRRFLGLESESGIGVRLARLMGCADRDGSDDCGGRASCGACRLREAVDKSFADRVRCEASDCQVRLFRDGHPVEMVFRLTTVPLGGSDTASVLVCLEEVTQATRLEQERRAAVELLRESNSSASIEELVRRTTKLVQQQTGCEAVGIRLREGDDYPYFETRGFSPDFIVAENYLCLRDGGEVVRDGGGNPVLECMCGNVLQGRFDPSKPFFTAGGSFWTNSSTELLASTTEADRQARTRNRCNGEGYESVALIPLSYGGETFGLLQMNDRRRGRFSPETIALWERVAGFLAVALSKAQSEARLRESEARYRALFSSMTEGFALHEILCNSAGRPIDYRFLDVNPAFERLTGLARDQLIGHTMREVLPTESVEWVEIYGAVALSGKPAHFERIAESIGRYYDVYAYQPAAGQFAVIFTDITERKRQEQSLCETEERLALAASSAQVGMFDWDVSTDVTVWTPQHEAIFGYPVTTETTAVHSYRDWIERVHPDDRPLAEARVHKCLTEQTRYEVEYRIILPDGSVRWIAGQGQAHYDDAGKPTRMLGTVMDITARKAAEEEIARAKQAAEAASRAKSEFLAVMSHEIRTPMTAILGFTDVLLQSVGTSPEQRECLGIIQRNGQALVQVINDILDLSKIESGKVIVQRAPCSLWNVTEEVVALMGVRAQQKGLRLEVEYTYPLPETISTDYVRLRQILLNLIGNAIKFTDWGGVWIAVSLAGDSADAERIRFAVHDTGVGISSDAQSKLFQSFSQVDMSTTRRNVGTGLGLAISLRMAQMLGGDIDVESAPGVGSTFTLSIDPGSLTGVPMLHDRPSPKPVAGAVAEGPQLRGRVLLAEDSFDTQRLVTTLLQRAGLTVDVAENGMLACERAKAAALQGRPYDLILMDMQMPVVDGLKASAELRSAGWEGPIVALTGHAMSGDRERCLAAGCDDYLTKPIQVSDFVGMLRRYLEAVEQQ